MKTAVFPGSFNPWHEAHENILRQALEVFDRVIVAQGINPAKADVPGYPEYGLPNAVGYGDRVEVVRFTGLLADFVKEQKAAAVVRGLRNVFDFYEEKDNQYWHEDLGLTVPIFYVISPRGLTHISSKAIKLVDQSKKVR